MALLKFKHGLQANLTNTPISEGTVYITTDSQEMKVDLGGHRLTISDFVIVANNEALEALKTAGTCYTNLFYYVEDVNLLKKYNGTDFVTLNDTSELDIRLGAVEGKAAANESNITATNTNLGLLQEQVDNLNASKINTTQDIIVTAPVGNYVKGQKVAIDDIQDIIKNMLSTDIDASVTTAVSASLSLSGAGAKEVGTEFTPSFSFSTNAGAYSQYRDPDTGNMTNQATGVVFSGYHVDEIGRPDSVALGESTSSSGKFTKFTVTDTMTSSNPYKLTGYCNSSAGNIPKTYLGIDDPKNQIQAKNHGTESAPMSSSTVTGYRAMFYGYFSTKAIADPTKITSAEVRALSGARLRSGTTYDTKTGPQTSLPSGAKAIKTNKMQQMFFAAPKGKYSNVAVANSTNGAPQTVTKVTDIMVEGLNGYDAIAYDVFYVSNAGAESGETIFDVTLS